MIFVYISVILTVFGICLAVCASFLSKSNDHGETNDDCPGIRHMNIVSAPTRRD